MEPKERETWSLEATVQFWLCGLFKKTSKQIQPCAYLLWRETDSIILGASFPPWLRSDSRADLTQGNLERAAGVEAGMADLCF